MTSRAIACYIAQTYKHKRLYVLDTGVAPSGLEFLPDKWPDFDITYHRALGNKTIGELRNKANGFACFDGAKILVHWDSDDLSHPNRIAEQAALLQSSGADCVGYNEVLFWREPRWAVETEVRAHGLPVGAGLEFPGEAWLYRNPHPAYAIGASLCYRREAWHRHQFESTSIGEDARFIAGLKCRGVSSVGSHMGHRGDLFEKPRLLCRIHPGNTSQAYRAEEMQKSAKQGGEWLRAQMWDKFCAGEFAR